MKVNIVKLPKSEIEIKVEVPSEEWHEFLNEAAKELSRDLKIEGFRPGYAPLKLVEERVGLAKILEEAAQHCARECYVRAILDNKIEAIGRPEISILKVAKDNPFEFKAKVAAMPEVKLPDYKKIAGHMAKDKKEVVVSQEEIDKSIEWFLKSRTKYITVARPAQEGDRVEIDFEGSCGGEKMRELCSKNQPAILGRGYFMPGFEKGIAGMREGEEKEFKLKFPDDFEHKNFAGKEVDFKAKMNLVQEAQIPRLSDEFAKSLGDFKNEAALKESVKEGLLAEKQLQEKDRLRTKMIQEIVKDSEMETPQILIDSETQRAMEDLKMKVSQTRLSYEGYLDKFKKTEQELKNEFEKSAKERVAAFLVLNEIAKKENINVSEQEVEEETNKALRHFENAQQAEQKIDIEQLKSYTKDVLKNEKVFETLESC